MGEIKDITSGTGFTAAHPAETSRGDAGVAGHKYKPISRWTEYPFQLYREGDTEQTIDPDHIHFGLMAYHAEGIKEVEFFLNGGEGVKVTEQEINPYTNLPEYCVRINKADVINTNDEETNNMELRAIVRPNSGVPRIHQHDKDVVLGEDLSLLTGYFTGFSGGKGDYFFDKKTTPGEFSQIGTIAKNKSNSVLDSITVFMRPDGVDTNNGTKDSPVKTIRKALEVIRDLAVDELPRRFTGEGVHAGKQYVDVTRSEIVLLRGPELLPPTDSSTEEENEFFEKGYNFAPYTSEHFGVDASGRVGDETSTNRTPVCKRGWFIVRGDFDVPREDIILTLTDAESQLGDDQLSRKEHISDFSLLHQNRTLNCFKIEHVFIDRPQTKIDQTELGFRMKSSVQPNDLIGGHTAESDLLWFHDVTIKSASIGGIHPQGSFIKNERQPDQCILMSGSAANRSKILGGDEVSVSFVNTINTDIIKNDGDCLKQYSLGLGLRLIGNNNSFGTWRRIWFDPNDEATERYAHFNGYYGSIRYSGRIRDNQQTDANGSPLFEHGTLNEYIRLHNLNTPAGVTLSWPKNPNGVAHPAGGDPNASTDDSSRNDVTVTGTLWQKINHTNFLDINVSWLKNPTSEDNFELTTYRDWGDLYRTDNIVAHTDAGDPYFGSTAERNPPVLSTINMPSTMKAHIIGPEKNSRFFFTRKSRVPIQGQLYPPQDEKLFERDILTDDMSTDEQVRLANFANGSSIYDPAQGQLNEDNYFYESKYCAMLKYQDSNLGITAWGQFLFDARKPLAADPNWDDGKVDDNGTDWGITQDFLFRLAGTTFPSAGLDDGSSFKSDWPYTKAQFLISPNVKKDRGQFDLAWAVGITSQGMSLEHRGSATESDFTSTPIFPENTHPIKGRANLGSRDTNHVDQSQIFASKNVDSIHTPENVLIAYCDNCLDGQPGQHSGSSTYMGAYTDFAYVNNVWSNIPVPAGDGFQFFPPSQKHILWYHNTFHNMVLNYGIGTSADRQYTFGVRPIKDDSASNPGSFLRSQYDKGQAIGGGVGGQPGFTLPTEIDAVVFRNNYITTCNDKDEWLTMGLSADGITLPYINRTTKPMVFERNFRWNGGPINSNLTDQEKYMIQLPTDNPPQFKQMIPFAGGATLDSKEYEGGPLRSPYDLIFNYQPTNDSPLVAGGTLGMEDQVQFDINRKRRIGHSTIGAVEVDSSYITANNEYVAQTSNNSSTNGDELFPSLSDGSTLMSFSVDFANHKNLYGKRIKVRATKEVEGAVEERFSDNILRLQRDRDRDEGSEGGNVNTRGLRSLILEPPNDPFTETYLFNSNNSIANLYVTYSAPSPDDFLLGAGETSDYGPDLEFETIETSASQNPTWLLTSYDISLITIYSSNFRTVTGDRNKIRLSFDTSQGDTRGTTLATVFHDSYAAAGGTLAIAFPNGTTFFVDKAAGGMTAHGSSLESYFFTNTTGTTVSLPLDLPTGEVLIEKPTGL